MATGLWVPLHHVDFSVPTLYDIDYFRYLQNDTIHCNVDRIYDVDENWLRKLCKILKVLPFVNENLVCIWIENNFEGKSGTVRSSQKEEIIVLCTFCLYLTENVDKKNLLNNAIHYNSLLIKWGNVHGNVRLFLRTYSGLPKFIKQLHQSDFRIGTSWRLRAAGMYKDMSTGFQEILSFI